MRFALIAAALLVTTAAFAEDCPVGARSCKIVTMTDEEINTLTGPNAVFDAATFANKMNLTPITDAWRKKIESSPAGTVKAETAPPAPASAPKPQDKK